MAFDAVYPDGQEEELSVSGRRSKVALRAELDVIDSGMREKRGTGYHWWWSGHDKLAFERFLSFNGNYRLEAKTL